MSKQISLTLPDEVYRRAEVLAGCSGREVADILATAIESSLDPLGLVDVAAPPAAPSIRSDEQVLADADAAMPAAEDERLTSLLDRQQAGRLSPEEETQLTALMQIYQQGMLRKARGLAEAVRRGLRPPPHP
jgi:predicted DNA-binding protein